MPCINLKCRITAAAKHFEPNAKIICRRCKLNFPETLRRPINIYWKRSRKLKRMQKKCPESRLWQLARASAAVEAKGHAVWARIKLYFNAPERPEGLDKFLEEMGL